MRVHVYEHVSTLATCTGVHRTHVSGQGAPPQLLNTTMVNHLEPPKQRNYGIYSTFQGHYKPSHIHVYNVGPIYLQYST